MCHAAPAPLSSTPIEDLPVPGSTGDRAVMGVRINFADGFCKECGKRHPRVRKAQVFCSTRCRKAWNNREALWGKKLVAAALAMRLDRRRGTFSDLTAIIDRDIIPEERARRARRKARIQEQQAERAKP